MTQAGRRLLYAGFLIGLVIRLDPCGGAPTSDDPAIATVLSVGQASALVATRPRLRLPFLKTLSPEVAAALAAKATELELPSLKAITSDVAEALVQDGRCYELDLQGITRVTPAVARVLAFHEGRLRLTGLRGLDPDVVAAFADNGGHLTGLAVPLPADTPLESLRSLARVGCNLECVGPATITADLAEAFAGYTKHLEFSGLVGPLSPAIARRLTFPGTLVVSGPITLSDEVADALRERSSGVWITGLTAITPAVASMLAKREESICLTRLKALDASAAVILATYAGPLIDLSAIERISLETARGLAPFRGRLCLNGLKELPLDVAAVLAEHPSWLELGTDSLSPAVAGVLARHADGFDLRRLRSLSLDAARCLAGKRGPLSIPDLEEMEPGAIEALAAKADVRIPPLESLEIVARVALERPAE